MRKLVVASLLCFAAVAGSERDASALSLFGLHLGGRSTSEQAVPNNSVDQAPIDQAPVYQAQSGQAPVIKVQNSDAEVRLQQLEDQMRQLNGRVEEMSYQLLQMQEQMRKTQEDNEFRFQQLEKRGGANAGGNNNGGSTTTIGGGSMKKSEADVPAQAPATGQQQDDIAGVIGDSQSDGASDTPQQGKGAGKAPTQLGSIQFDQSGKPVGGTATRANNSSGAAPATTAPAQTASIGGSEGDQYKAAYDHVLAGDYADAEQEFQQYIQSYPNSARAADANFWLGEALYSQGKYNDAAKTFLNAHQKYGNSEKAPTMLLRLGMSLAALDNKDTACATLREVTKRYPKAEKAVTSKVASEEKRLAC